MIGILRLVSLVVLGLGSVFIGCKDDSSPSQALPENLSSVEPTLSPRIVPKPVQLSERDCEVMHFVLATEAISDGGKQLYLTPTVREQWNQQGDWVSMPTEFGPWLDQLAVEFRPAIGAKLDKGYVRDIETNTRGTMVWIAVVEWLSSEEVTLEFGLWGGPLEASGKTITCLKKNGEWQVQEVTNVWLS